jgi:hypothetical protein
LPGGRQIVSPDHHAKPGSGRQTPTPRRPTYTAGLFGSVVCTSAAVPMAAIGTTLPRWLVVLAVLFLAVGGMIVGAIAAVMPQESKDRLSWWREWLGHRERMAGRRGSAPPPTRPGKSAHVPGKPPQLPASSTNPETLPSSTMPTSNTTQPCAAPVTEELVPE